MEKAEFGNKKEPKTTHPVRDGMYFAGESVAETRRRRTDVEDLNGKPEGGAECQLDNDGVNESERSIKFSKDRMTTRAFLVVALLLVFAVFGAGIFFCGQLESIADNGHEEVARTENLTDKPHERGSGAREKPNHKPRETGTTVPVEEFEEHVRRLHTNGGLLFSQQYSALRPRADFTWKASLTRENRHKNRYIDTVAYDNSWVKLSPIQSAPGFYYRNANFLDGYQKKKAYIATQGPLPETENDVWRMISDKLTVMGALQRPSLSGSRSSHS